MKIHDVTDADDALYAAKGIVDDLSGLDVKEDPSPPRLRLIRARAAKIARWASARLKAMP